MNRSRRTALEFFETRDGRPLSEVPRLGNDPHRRNSVRGGIRSIDPGIAYLRQHLYVEDLIDARMKLEPRCFASVTQVQDRNAAA